MKGNASLFAPAPVTYSFYHAANIPQKLKNEIIPVIRDSVFVAYRAMRDQLTEDILNFPVGNLVIPANINKKDHGIYAYASAAAHKAFDLLSKPNVTCCCAADGDALVGLVIFDRKQADIPEGVQAWYHIEYLHVNPKHFRKGIGTRLMKEVEKHCTEMVDPFDQVPKPNASEDTLPYQITLDTGQFNNPAIRLYKKSGYKQLGRSDNPKLTKPVRGNNENPVYILMRKIVRVPREEYFPGAHSAVLCSIL